MSRTDLRRLLLIGAAAFVLRAGVAVLTEYKPIFPDYYYTDARLVDQMASASYEAARAGRPFEIDGPLSQHLQVAFQVLFYRVFGPHPFLIKLANCVLGALAVVVLGWSFGLAFDPKAALSAAALWSLWPSAAFYTSQNLKESPTILLTYLALAAATALALGRGGRLGAASAAAAMGAALLGAGFYRSSLMLAAAASAGVLFLGELALRRSRRGSLALGLAVASAAVVAYKPASRFLLRHGLSASSASTSLTLNTPQLTPTLIPVIYDLEGPAGERTTQPFVSPTSPEGLSRFRAARQYADRRWAGYFAHREIGTQILPGAQFHGWLDVLLFVPKAAFYVLFMPLPGLYALDGKLGRIMASLENVGLLALAVLGLIGAARGPKTPARIGLLLFFFAMTAGASLLEYDLGSAGRHKVLYLPMLFPFAAEEILRLLGRKEPA